MVEEADANFLDDMDDLFGGSDDEVDTKAGAEK